MKVSWFQTTMQKEIVQLSYQTQITNSSPDFRPHLKVILADENVLVLVYDAKTSEQSAI